MFQGCQLCKLTVITRQTNIKWASIKYFRSMIEEIGTTFPDKPGTLVLWDIALHDAFAKYLNIPVTAIYGQHIHSLL